jgi:cardiolipin synthase (CMP-forming)
MSFRWLPNGLCVLRMLLAPPTAWLLLRGEYWLTLLVFFVAAVTDAADGYLAKRYGWETELGKALDPLADKLLLVTAFITLAILGLVPVWLAVLVVVRDLLITVGAITYRVLYGPIVGAAPTLISKLNTVVQIMYVFAVVCSAAMAWSMPLVLRLMAWCTAITTVSSGADYVVTYSRRAVIASRAQRRA